MQELEASLLLKLGDRINARIEGLEPRLNPAPLLRPPLAADTAKRGKKVIRNSPVLPAVVTPVAPVVTAVDSSSGKDTRRGKEKKMDGPSRPLNPDTLEENWVTVAKKKKKKEDKTQPRTGPAPKPKKSPQAKSKPKPKLRMPRSSAVVITLTDEGRREPRRRDARKLRDGCPRHGAGFKGLADTSPLSEQCSDEWALGWFSG
ncbi:unnamed protein product [Leptosia nina]|uniref:Histone H1 n=1 Tax=Leptosia nina TaxID=320188 RepID=A0AAV1J3S9_9NEOP